MRGKILNYLKALSQSGGRFESHGATGLDIDYFAGPRIPSHSCLPRFYREGAKRRHLKSFIFLDRSCERSKGCVDGTFGSSLAHLCRSGHHIDEITFSHIEYLLRL